MKAVEFNELNILCHIQTIIRRSIFWGNG